MSSKTERPDIFAYHDYLGFLRDWLAYRKAGQSSFSMRALAKSAALSTGYLPMVMSGKRPLTGKALSKLAPFLGLTASEFSFLENLVTLGTTDSHDARLAALDRMKRFQSYQRKNLPETEVLEYFTHWHYVAIRELASLSSFKLDPEWIQARLKVAVPIKSIKDAIEFLLAKGFLELDSKGAVQPPERSIECTGTVYRVALTGFHRDIFELAAKSIENTPSDKRNIQGHTFAIREESYSKAKKILDDAISQVKLLGAAEKGGDSVYHMEIALFPLTKEGNQK